MALESVAYVTGLNTANPPNTDQRKQGDDHLRLIKTATKQSMELAGAKFTTAGTAPAFTLTTSHANSPTLQDGHLYTFLLHASLVGADTLNVDTLGAKALKKMTAAGWAATAANDALTGHAILAYYEAADTTFRIIATYNGGLAYLALTGGTVDGNVVLRTIDAGPGSTPTFTLFHDSSSPAVADFGGILNWDGRSSTGVQRTYARMLSQVTDPTNASEDADFFLQTLLAGSMTTRLQITATALNVTGNMSVSGALTTVGGLAGSGVFNEAGLLVFRFGTGGSDTRITLSASAMDFGVGGTANVLAVSAARGALAKNTACALVIYEFPAGVPTVTRSVNVASLTDNGVGDTTVNLTTAVAAAEVTHVTGSSRLVASGNAHFTSRNLDRTQTTSALQLCTHIFDSSLVDAVRGSAAWFDGA